MTNQGQHSYEDRVSRPSLPVEKFTNIDPSRLSVAVIIVIVIVIIANIFAVLYLKIEPINLGQVVVRDKWHRIYEIVDPLDYLILGDSTVNQAFDPAIVAEELNLNGVNLGTIGTFGFIDDLWLLQTYIERVGVPEVVVIVHSFDVPQREVSVLELLGTYSIPISSIIMHSSFVDFSNPANAMQVYQRRIFPLMYRNESLISAITILLRHGLAAFDDKYLFSSDGYMPWRFERVEDIDLILEGYQQRIDADLVSGRFSEQNLHAIDEIINLAEDYDFDVIFANGPTYNRLENGFSTVRQQMDAQYEAFDQESTHVRYISNTFPFPLEAMDSLDHINADFADDYTIALMHLIWIE